MPKERVLKRERSTRAVARERAEQEGAAREADRLTKEFIEEHRRSLEELAKR